MESESEQSERFQILPISITYDPVTYDPVKTKAV